MKPEIEYYKSYICSRIKEIGTRRQLVITTVLSGIVPWLICIFIAKDSQLAFWISIAVYTLPFITAAYIYSFTDSPKIYQLVKADVLRAASVYITYDISTVLLLDRINADLTIILCSVVIPAVVFASAIVLKLIFIDYGRYKRSGGLGVGISGCFALGYIVAQYANNDYDADFGDMSGYKLLAAGCFFAVLVMSIKITDALKLYYIHRIENNGISIEELILSDIRENDRKSFKNKGWKL